MARERVHMYKGYKWGYIQRIEWIINIHLANQVPSSPQVRAHA